MTEAVDIVGREGVSRVVEVNVSEDTLGGLIAVGDTFSVTVTEILHPDESTGTWPENMTGGEGNRNGNPHSWCIRARSSWRYRHGYSP